MDSFTFKRQISGKRKMRKTKPSTKPWQVPCSKCGKPTFSDLLDAEGMCDYCREVRSMKTAAARRKGKRKEGR